MIFLMLMLLSDFAQSKSLEDFYFDAFKLNVRDGSFSNKALDIEKLEYEEQQFGDLSLNTGLFLQSESRGNTLLVGDRSYSLDRDSEESNSLISLSLSYKKNLWNRGVDSSFNDYLDKKKLRIRIENSLAKVKFYKSLNNDLFRLLQLNKQIDLSYEELEYYKKIDRHVRLLLKRGLISSISGQSMKMRILNFESDLVKIKTQQKVLESHLRYIFRGRKLPVILSTLSSRINSQSISRGIDLDKVCDVPNISKYLLLESQSEQRYKKHSNKLRLDVIANASLTDRNGWESPDSNLSAGVLLSIPFGSNKSLNKKYALSRLSYRYKRKKTKKMNDLLRSNLLLRSSHLRDVYQYSSTSKQLFLRDKLKYEKLFYKGLLSLDTLLKAYSSYRKSVYAISDAVFQYNLLVVQNKILCGVRNEKG